MLALTNKDSWILDPYVGFGSTIIASLKNERNIVGVDKENEYIQIEKKRIAELERGMLKLRPISKPIHQSSANDKIVQVPSEWLKKE